MRRHVPQKSEKSAAGTELGLHFVERGPVCSDKYAEYEH